MTNLWSKFTLLAFESYNASYNKELISGRNPQWAVQLASVLAYLHEQSPPIIHRDLKLQNILLSAREKQL